MRYGDSEHILEIRRLQYNAAKAMGAWLSGEIWTDFFTVTFAKPQSHPFTAIHRVTSTMDRCFVRKAFVAAEQHESGYWHVHGLLEDTSSRDNLRSENEATVRDYLRHRWSYLGWNRCEPVGNIGGAIGYCTKYILKQTPVEWDFVWDC